MNVNEIYSAKAIASVVNEAASNKIPYLGEGFFPAKKKMGLDLKTILSAKGLPVALKPSAFDTVSTIRSREGVKITETQMAFFKESMLLKEQDEQDILRLQDSTDPYANEVISRIYNDAETLVDGAMVIPEIMRMQLLSSCTTSGGHAYGPSISINADGATYAYNYDDAEYGGTYATNNYVKLAGTSKWDAPSTADPMKDISDAQDAIEASTGSRPTGLIISKATMNYLKQNDKIKGYIVAANPSSSVFITDARVKELFATELGVTIYVYTKQYKNYAGSATKFFPDGKACLIPDGALGSTWFGTAPLERQSIADPNSNVALVNTGVAVGVAFTKDPEQTKTTVEEIVLPSFERMLETYQIECY